MEVGRCASTSNWSLQIDPDSRRGGGGQVGVAAETVGQLCERGHVAEAVEGLGVLVQRDCPISTALFYGVLKSCMVKKDLVLGRRVHAATVRHGYQSDRFLGNHILRMYASHGRLEEAMDVFTVVRKPDAFMWSSIITAHVKHGEAEHAVQLYRQMRRSKVKPDGHVFVAALQACARGADLKAGEEVHADVLASGVEPDAFVCSCLVDMYAKCGSLEDAQRLFDWLPKKSVVTWNTMITGYSAQGMGEEALRLYSAMQREGSTAPNSVTFVCLLQACASVGVPALEKGKQLHTQIKEQGIQVDVVVGCSLVNMYAKCGSLQDARSVFDTLSHRNVVTWTALIAGYSQHGMGQEALNLYTALQDDGFTAPDPVTFVCLLQACATVGSPALDTGKQLHAQIGEQGLQADLTIGNNLVNMYAKCGSLEDARSVFDRLGRKDAVTWTALIAGYSRQGMGKEALAVYSAMQEEGVAAPDSVTFLCLLQACASEGTSALEKGKLLHAEIGERQLQLDVAVGCSLVNMYAKCGSLKDAQSVFDKLPEKNEATWTALIQGYSQHGLGQEALHRYRAMEEEGLAAHSGTFLRLLQACASMGASALEDGKELHARIERQGLQSDVSLSCSLINMYAKCGSLEDAQRVFDGLGKKDVVIFNAMIAGYSQQGMGEEALRLYSTMPKEGIGPPDSVTFLSLLQACASLGALYAGRHLHAQIREQGLESDQFVAISLINMYAKSGSMVDAQEVFDALPQRDVIAWNALIAGYTRQGDSGVVFHLVRKMQEEDGLLPDAIILLSVLTVCSHAGLVDKGRELFESMNRESGITPTAEHYSCMVDLLGRAGQLDEALALVKTMPVPPHGALWLSLLGSSRKWGNVDVGRCAFDEAVKLDEKDAAPYVLMANIYTGVQMLEQAQEMHARRKLMGAWKLPGQSWWTDMDGLAHSFVVGDRKHPESDDIYAKLDQLVLRMKEEECVPKDLNGRLNNVNT